ncbi:hypothetical protein, partial [Deinococcus marmoris]|uniref:hypothetical protein n=1 Tax=Deinococcus marmoris TaxID=249408 RepID=UPI001B807690
DLSETMARRRISQITQAKCLSWEVACQYTCMSDQTHSLFILRTYQAGKIENHPQGKSLCDANKDVYRRS